MNPAQIREVHTLSGQVIDIDKDIDNLRKALDDLLTKRSDALTALRSSLKTPKDTDSVLTCKGKGYHATARVVGKSFLVLKGSVMRRRGVPSMGKSRLRSRDYLLQQAIVRLNLNGELEFVQDYAFPTPSFAATVISGRRTSGAAVWKSTPEPVPDPEPEPPTEQGTNDTQWLGAFFEAALPYLRRHMARNFPSLDEMGLVEDAIHNFLLTLLERGSLSSFESPPTLWRFRRWCWLQTVDQISNWGQDAHVQAAWGLLPQSLQQEDQSESPWTPRGILISHIEYDSQEWQPQCPSPENDVAHKRTVERIREVVSRKHRKAQERYAKVALYLYEGFSIMDIAKREGVSRNRAASMVAAVRATVRSSTHPEKEVRVRPNRTCPRRKRHVETLLRRNPLRSNRDVAKSVGCDQNLVRRLRQELEQRGEIRNTVVRNAFEERTLA